MFERKFTGMTEIIDSPQTNKTDNRNIRKSAAVLRIYGVIILGLILLTFLTDVLWESDWQIVSIIFSVIFLLASVVAAPFGLVYISRAYRNRESSAGWKLIHLIVHGVFLLLILLTLIIFVADVLHLPL